MLGHRTIEFDELFFSEAQYCPVRRNQFVVIPSGPFVILDKRTGFMFVEFTHKWVFINLEAEKNAS